MDENNLFREAFSLGVARQIGTRISKVWKDFDTTEYLGVLEPAYEALGFGDRAKRIVDGLAQTLPGNFAQAAGILCDALGPEPHPESELTGFDGFYVVPLTMYISRFGLDDPDTSLAALYEMTKRFSAESEVRPFIIRYPEKTMAFLWELALDPSPFARRLATEGTRPRLPLACRLPQFQKDPRPVIKLLDKLCTDTSPMVRRSVANNINDISKDNPDLAVECLARWRTLHPGAEIEAVIRHGLRTLIKTSHPGALALLGFGSTTPELEDWQTGPLALTLGESLNFSARINSNTPGEQRVAINYIIHFVKANGQRKPKVFRMPDKVLYPGKPLTISRTHVFRDYKNQSFYPGIHVLELSLNGCVVASSEFELKI